MSSTTISHRRPDRCCGPCSLTASACSSTCSAGRSEEHTSELQSLMRISYAVFCLKKKTKQKHNRELTAKTINNKTEYKKKHRIPKLSTIQSKHIKRQQAKNIAR